MHLPAGPVILRVRRTLVRQIWLPLAIAVAFTVAIAFAGSLDVELQAAASGTAPITACGNVTGFELLPAEGQSGPVDAVRLVVDTSCKNGKAFIALLRDGDVLATGGPGAISGGQMTIDVEPDVPASEITHLRVTLVGP